MATPNFAKKNPFMRMTVAQMKAHYDKNVRGKKLTLEQKRHLANQMQAAKKAAPKAAPKAKPAASKPRQTTRAEAERRFYSSSSQGSIAKNQEKAKRNFFRSSSGTRGQSRPSNSPGPAVRRRGSTTGASVDPRERQLRKNRQEAAAAARRRNRNLRINRRGRRS